MTKKLTIIVTDSKLVFTAERFVTAKDFSSDIFWDKHKERNK